MLKSNSRNTNLARGSVFSAEHTSKIIQYKSQVRALKPIFKCMKTSEMKYLQINNSFQKRNFPGPYSTKST